MKTTFSVLFFTFLLFTDQITKIASDFFSDGLNFINPICNSNIAWGVPVKPAFFYPLWFAIIFLLINYFLQAKNKFHKLALALILSGAMSNMIDRVIHGCVIDFIDLKVWPASIATRSVAGWPVFNLADIYITIGIITLLIILLKSKAQNPNIKSSSKSKIEI